MRAAHVLHDTPVHVTRLSVTPVKGLGLHHPETLEVDETGAVGDRDFFCVDDRDKLVSITRTGGWAGLHAEHDPATGRLTLRDGDGEVWEDEVCTGERIVADHAGIREIAGHVVAGPWAAPLSERAGMSVRLVRAEQRGSGSDIHPVTFLNHASLDALVRDAGLEHLDARRFRMLVDFAGSEPYEEEGWAGRSLEIGTATFTVGGPVPRCAATTRDPDEGDRDVPVVKLLQEVRGFMDGELGRGLMFGVYGRVTTPGRVAVGDALTLR